MSLLRCGGGYNKELISVRDPLEPDQCPNGCLFEEVKGIEVSSTTYLSTHTHISLCMSAGSSRLLLGHQILGHIWSYVL